MMCTAPDLGVSGPGSAAGGGPGGGGSRGTTTCPAVTSLSATAWCSFRVVQVQVQVGCG